MPLLTAMSSADSLERQNWFEASAGGKLYADLTTLLEAAFHVAEVSKPRWVERLAVELAGPITVRLRSPADGA